jgi:isoaspartyl peptidase/L-asparaginase-like protein (Ntn-hydrolase superfamily)
MIQSRRGFLAGTAGAVISQTTLVARPSYGADSSAGVPPAGRPLFVSTWPFGKAANERARETIQQGGSMLDAVEQGIRLTESAGLESVGLSGGPNAAGVRQLDACIMNGPGHQAGACGGVERVVHPITLARRVMEKTPHVMLVGKGAQWFAIEEGLETVSSDTDEQYEQWRRTRAQSTGDIKVGSPENHDTIALLGLAADGTIAAGCSTSGLAGKLPGRVGDSPIIGSGLYVDNEVGAAGATGIGENVMRYCGSFMVVEAMRHGMSPTEACEDTIRRIARIDPLGDELNIHFVALDKHGRHGAAGPNRFPYSVTSKDFSHVLRCEPL